MNPRCPDIVFLDSNSSTESLTPVLGVKDKLWIGVGAGLGAAVFVIGLLLMALFVPLCVSYHNKKKMFNSIAKVRSENLFKLQLRSCS